MFKKINNIDLQVLSLFTQGYTVQYYIREVGKLAHISSRSALLILEKYEQAGILTSIIKGKIKMYHLQQTLFAKEFMILVEQYKKILFLEEQILIREFFGQIQEHIKGILVVFGSYAKKKQTKNSDVDLLIVGSYQEKKIKEIAKTYHLQIDIKNYTRHAFKKYIQEDFLLKEILNNHIILQGESAFVQEAMIWKK